MIFSSYEFLFFFLPASCLGFLFLLQRKSRKLALVFLVLASLFFYGWWDPIYLLLIGASIVINYTLGLGLQSPKFHLQNIHIPKKIILISGISINIGLITYFKYIGLFSETFSAIFNLGWTKPEVVLPLAISFFTFEQIAFLIDTYQGKTQEKNFLNYCLFVLFFPRLIAGPIVLHQEIISQFFQPVSKLLTSKNIAVGITLFSIGLFKKAVIADNLAPFANKVFQFSAQGQSPTFLVAWCGVLAYAGQLYFDFSGYSDMAIGAARLFGIKLPVNFNSPYKAKDISDFWRRWHMTLSHFLRNYLYIPLGGNRLGETRRQINLMITMLLGGLWHGAGWNFVLWGGLHGLYLIIHRRWQLLCRDKQWKFEQNIRWFPLLEIAVTFLSVLVAWVFFRAPTLASAQTVLAGMLGLNGVTMPSGLGKYFGVFKYVGIKFEGVATPGFSIVTAGTMITLALAIIWFLPNTQEWLRYHEPTLNYSALNDQSQGIEQPKSDQTNGTRWEQSIWNHLAWQPTLAWAFLTMLITTIGIYSISGNNEFIYFNF